METKITTAAAVGVDRHRGRPETRHGEDLASKTVNWAPPAENRSPDRAGRSSSLVSAASQGHEGGRPCWQS